MLVSKSKYVDLQRALKVETGRREVAEAKAQRQTAAIERLQAQLHHHHDEHPDTPVPVQPATGDARAAHLLALSERARRSLDEQLLTLHRANMHQEQEIASLRAQLAALQAAEAVAS
ncbi:hypothetical protein [Streptomyces sp. NPDC017086]|uniref:hypothetical protein n=1 Tax=Streptomyces sp. NPDC017086 TaxID=3364976 RepID=UPI0037B76176